MLRSGRRGGTEQWEWRESREERGGRKWSPRALVGQRPRRPPPRSDPSARRERSRHGLGIVQGPFDQAEMIRNERGRRKMSRHSNGQNSENVIEQLFPIFQGINQDKSEMDLNTKVVEGL